MNSSQRIIKSESSSKPKYQFVSLLEIYLDEQYGSELWDNMLQDKQFSNLIVNYFPNYGDAVFKEVVDLICEKYSIPHIDLLDDFSRFVRSYYE